MDHFEESEAIFDDALLVDTVARFPALYDLKVAEYHNNLVKARCWEMVSQVMNESVAKCMARWVRLKDNFRREKNKREKESRSGQGLSQRKGFSLYASMNFMHSNMIKRKTLNNARASSSGIKSTKPGNSDSQFTANAVWQPQYQSISWNQVSPTTSNYPDTVLPTLSLAEHERSTHVWMPAKTVPMLIPTATASITSPVTIDTCPRNPNNQAIEIGQPANVTEPARTWMAPMVVTSPAATCTTPTTVNEPTMTSSTPTTVTEPTMTLTTHTACTEPSLLARVPTTVMEPVEIPTAPITAPEPMITPTATTATEIAPMHMPSTTTSLSVRTTATPLTRISAQTVCSPQSSPHTMSSPFSFRNAGSANLSDAPSPAPPSPADSVYSSLYSDLSCDLNDTADTAYTRNSHVSTQRENRFMKSPSASLSTPFTLGCSAQNKNSSGVPPKSCYNKHMRQKKIDPLEACMISLSHSIKDKLEAEPAPKQKAKTPNQVFGDMVAAELSHMSEEDRINAKALIVNILFARSK